MGLEERNYSGADPEAPVGEMEPGIRVPKATKKIGVAPRKTEAMGPPAGEIPIPALPPEAKSRGYTNPGAFLGGGDFASDALGKTLTKQMLERPSVADKSKEFGDFYRQNADRMRMDAVKSSPGPLPGMTDFQPPTGEMVHDKAMAAFMGLDKQAQDQEERALKKYLGVGHLGTEVTKNALQGGQLEVAQRAQQEAERQGGYGRDKSVEAMKLFQGLKLAGKDNDEAIAAANLGKSLGPEGTPSTQGFRVNPSNPTVPLRPAGSPGPGGTVVDKAAGPKQDAYDAAKESLEFEKAFGVRAHGAAKAAKSLPEAIVALHGAMNEKDFVEKLPLIQKYLSTPRKDQTGFSPRDWDLFINPTVTQQLGRSMHNAWARPSNEEVLMSKIRNHMGVGRAPGFYDSPEDTLMRMIGLK